MDARALANETGFGSRIEVLEELDEQKSVKEIEQELKYSDAHIYRVLRHLDECGMVEKKTAGMDYDMRAYVYKRTVNEIHFDLEGEVEEDNSSPKIPNAYANR